MPRPKEEPQEGGGGAPHSVCVSSVQVMCVLLIWGHTLRTTIWGDGKEDADLILSSFHLPEEGDDRETRTGQGPHMQHLWQVTRDGRNSRSHGTATLVAEVGTSTPEMQGWT